MGRAADPSRRTLLVFCLGLAVLLGAPRHASADPAEVRRHLLAGVEAFQAGRYETALIEFRVVGRSPSPPADLAFYLGPTLHKLGRHAEAAEVLLAVPAPRELLAELYLGQALYQQRLFLAAREVFVGLRGRGLGPRLEGVVDRYVGLVEALYAAAPPIVVAGVYETAAVRELAAGRSRLAALYRREAAEIRQRAGDRR
jgi:hypothetical protein